MNWASVGWAAPVLAVVILAGCGSPPSASPSAAPPVATKPTSPTSPPTHVGPPILDVSVLPWRLPEPVARQAVMATPDGVIVAGGLIAGDGSTSAAYRLDFATGKTTALPDLPVPVHDVGGATLLGVPMVFGGGNALEQDVVQMGGGSTGEWRVGGHLPVARSDLSAVETPDDVYVLGGFDGVSTALADILVTSDGTTFRVAGRLGVPVRYAAVASTNDALWVFGGERDGMEVDDIQRVDLNSGDCETVGHLEHPLGHASAVTLDGYILLVGGRRSYRQLTSVMSWFDPATRTFTPAGSLPNVLADSAVVTEGSATYLVGGQSPHVTDRVIRLR